MREELEARGFEAFLANVAANRVAFQPLGPAGPGAGHRREPDEARQRPQGDGRGLTGAQQRQGEPQARAEAPRPVGDEASSD
jgi:hypothetical protein